MNYAYNITKQYARGGETDTASFQDLSDAELFVEMKREKDTAMGVKVIYRIYKAGDVIKEYSGEADATTSGSSGQGQTSGARFSPTPFNTTPRPSGTPPKWTTPTDEEEDKS